MSGSKDFGKTEPNRTENRFGSVRFEYFIWNRFGTDLEPVWNRLF